ncbi:hypothetical protein [Geoalkalibacter halelectricus]|uniref:hypothetical protein n=1 Tax=Geoalkalibacter halelectricus TaxID=2847045 RepID=UPI00266F2A68|nr:hypothetical protein [Geoalkalibacter halelectricus]MDO3378329.1 hypothetical protein [Geoalkalibacter halelectricus]
MPIEEHYSSDPFMRRGSACGGFRNAFDSPFSSSADHRRDPFRHDPWPKPPPQEPPRPWRGIAVETLPSNLKKQLSPHYSDWIVVDPEQARYRRPGAQLQLFAEHKNGWAPIADLSRLDFAQKHYALARRTSTRPRGGAAGGLAAVAPPWARPVVRGTCEPTPGVRIKSPADGAVLPLASQRFSVEGNAYDAQNIRVVWHNLASGHSGQFTQAARRPFGASQWRGLLEADAAGDYQLSARAEAPGGSDLHQIRLRLVEEIIPVAEILYELGTNTFYLLEEQDDAAFQAAAAPFEEAVAALEQSYAAGDEERIAAAKQHLDRTLAPLIDADTETCRLTEVIGLRGGRYAYLDSRDIALSWRHHRIKDMTQGTLIEGEQLKFDRLKEVFGQKHLHFTWDLVEPHSQTLSTWAQGVNCRLSNLLLPPNNPNRRFDVSSQAQILRYTHGASLRNSVDFADKTFGLSTELAVKLTLAEARTDFNGYIPRAEGHPLRFGYRIESGPRQGEVKQFDCGPIRAKLQTALTGFAGASFQVANQVHFDIAPSGKVEARGATRTDPEESNGQRLGGQAFAGLKRGCEVSGAAEWQNPERGGYWGTLAQVGYEGTAGVGAGVKGDFFIEYERGRFIISAKAHLVWGLGGGGGFVFSVHGNTIAEFCLFVYHQLKNNDFSFLDFMSEDAFRYFDILRSYVLLAGELIEVAYEKGVEFRDVMRTSIQRALRNLQDVRVNQQEAMRLAERILRNPDLVLFQAPEGKGRLLRALCQSQWPFPLRAELQEDAILTILETIQTWNEYKEIMEHLTMDGSRLRPAPEAGIDDWTWREGESILYRFLDGAQEREFIRMRQFLKNASNLTRQPQVHTAAVRDNGIALA